MALPTSGEISFTQLQTEYGGVNPIEITEYYGAAYGVPTSGQISMSSFYGASLLDTQTVTVGQLPAGQYNTEQYGYQDYIFVFGSISDGTINWAAGEFCRGIFWASGYDTITINLKSEVAGNTNSGFNAMALNGQTFLRTDASYNFSGSGASSNRGWTWSNVTTSPFGTTIGATKTVTFS